MSRAKELRRDCGKITCKMTNRGGDEIYTITPLAVWSGGDATDYLVFWDYERSCIGNITVRGISHLDPIGPCAVDLGEVCKDIWPLTTAELDAEGAIDHRQMLEDLRPWR